MPASAVRTCGEREDPMDGAARFPLPSQITDAPASYEGLPASRRPHLLVRGVDELLEIVQASQGG
jgi:hypothetical protein